MKHSRQQLIIIFCFIVISLFIVTISNSSKASPSENGGEYHQDWIVTDLQEYRNCEIILTGNLTIENGGSLTLVNVTLRVNCTVNGEHKIEVKRGGTFLIIDEDNDRSTMGDGSIISDVNNGFPYLFWVSKGSIFEMKNSFLSGCGYRADNDFPNKEMPKGVFIEAENIIFGGNTVSDCYNALILNNTKLFILENNTFLNLSKFGALVFKQSSYGFINNSKFIGTMISLTNVSNTEFIGNNFLNHSSNGGIGGSLSNCVIRGNVFQNNPRGIHIGNSLYSSTGNSIVNNKFLNNTNAVLLDRGASNNNFYNNSYYGGGTGVNLAGYESDNRPNSNLFTNEIFNDHLQQGVSLYQAENNTFIRCNFFNPESEDISVRGDHTVQNVFIDCQFNITDIRDGQLLHAKTFLGIQIINNEKIGIEDVEVEVDHDGLIVYSTQVYGGIDAASNSNGIIGAILITCSIHYQDQIDFFETRIQVNKNWWEDSRIINTSNPYNATFIVPKFELEGPRVTPVIGDQDTMFTFSLDINNEYTEWCELTVGNNTLPMTMESGNTWSVQTQLTTDIWSYWFRASNQLEIIFSEEDILYVEDTIPPPLVQLINSSDHRNGSITIIWEPYIGDDKSYYHLYLSSNNFSSVNGMDPIEVLDENLTQYLLTLPGIGETYFIALTAIDVSGNEMDSVTPIPVISTNPGPQVVIKSFTIDQENPVDGELLKFTFIVEKVGSESKKTVIIGISLDGNEIFNSSYQLVSNGTILSDFITAQATKGSHSVIIYVWCSGYTYTDELTFISVEENDEDNFILNEIEPIVLIAIIAIIVGILVAGVFVRKRNSGHPENSESQINQQLDQIPQNNNYHTEQQYPSQFPNAAQHINQNQQANTAHPTPDPPPQKWSCPQCSMESEVQHIFCMKCGFRRQ